MSSWLQRRRRCQIAGQCCKTTTGGNENMSRAETNCIAADRRLPRPPRRADDTRPGQPAGGVILLYLTCGSALSHPAERAW